MYRNNKKKRSSRPDRNKKETFDQMSEEEEEEAVLLDLFDSFWYEFPIFSSKPSLSSSSKEKKVELVPETSRTVLHARSMSETDVAVATSASNVSPDSVLSLTPKLETVLSGKEADDFLVDGGSRFTNAREEIERPGSGKGATRRRRAGIGRTSSRSLSELEFEELKGFMDLGFVFSERDRDSATLTSIIPGLHRLGEGGGEIRTAGVSRPYLSEAWGAVELQRKTQAMKWRMQEIGNNDERAMKDQLKFWAQAVASAVR